MDYRVLLFYKYIGFADPENFRDEHLQFCKENDILGRVWISHEGINGTVSGLKENIELYKKEITAYPEFGDIWFKEDKYSEHTFRKIHVRVKISVRLI